MRAVRIAVVTAGLSVAGALFGGLAGTLVLAGWIAAEEGLRWVLSPDLLVLGGGFGGALGAVLGPLAAWLLMRHVPLGLAFAGTMLGTVAGGAFGLALTNHPVVSLAAGMAGFGAAALGLRMRIPRDRHLAGG